MDLSINEYIFAGSFMQKDKDDSFRKEMDAQDKILLKETFSYAKGKRQDIEVQYGCDEEGRYYHVGHNIHDDVFDWNKHTNNLNAYDYEVGYLDNNTHIQNKVIGFDNVDMINDTMQGKTNLFTDYLIQPKLKLSPLPADLSGGGGGGMSVQELYGIASTQEFKSLLENDDYGPKNELEQEMHDIRRNEKTDLKAAAAKNLTNRRISTKLGGVRLRKTDVEQEHRAKAAERVIEAHEQAQEQRNKAATVIEKVMKGGIERKLIRENKGELVERRNLAGLKRALDIARTTKLKERVHGQLEGRRKAAEEIQKAARGRLARKEVAKKFEGLPRQEQVGIKVEARKAAKAITTPTKGKRSAAGATAAGATAASQAGTSAAAVPSGPMTLQRLIDAEQLAGTYQRLGIAGAQKSISEVFKEGGITNQKATNLHNYIENNMNPAEFQALKTLFESNGVTIRSKTDIYKHIKIKK